MVLDKAWNFARALHQQSYTKIHCHIRLMLLIKGHKSHDKHWARAKSGFIGGGRDLYMAGGLGLGWGSAGVALGWGARVSPRRGGTLLERILHCERGGGVRVPKLNQGNDVGW